MWNLAGNFVIGNIVNGPLSASRYTLSFDIKDSEGATIVDSTNFNPIYLNAPGDGEVTITVLKSGTPSVFLQDHPPGWLLSP